jgi:hypothetical protein
MARQIDYTFFTKLQCDELLTEKVAVDNILLDGNTISSTSGDINITPLAGQDIVLDGHWEVDGTTITALTNANSTINAYTGKNITIEGVTFVGGVCTATTFVGALTGAATQVVVADTTDTTCYVALFEDATGNLAPKTDAGATYNASTGAMLLTQIGNSVSQPILYSQILDYATQSTTINNTVANAVITLSYNGARTLVLPTMASARKGVCFTVINTQDNDITISPQTAGELVAKGSAAIVSCEFKTSSEKIGAVARIFCDGTKWYVSNASDCTMTYNV